MDDDQRQTSFPLAMAPPEKKVTVITTQLMESAIVMSRKSPRGRIICPLHKSVNDSLQRMLNVIQPGSYIRPHRHLNPPKVETIIVLKGILAFITFSKDGQIEEIIKLSNQSNQVGIDVEPDIYHSFLALKEDTVLFEIKPGPYQQIKNKDFAHWAPEENSDRVKKYIKSLYGFIDKDF